MELRHGQLQAVLQGNDHDGHPRLATPIRRSPGTQYRKRLLVLDLRPAEQDRHGLACRRTGAGPLEVPGETALLLRLQVLGYSRCHLDLPGTIVVLSGCRNLSIPDPSPRPPVAQTRAPSDFQRADRPSAHARSDRALRKSSPRRSPDSVLVLSRRQPDGPGRSLACQHGIEPRCAQIPVTPEGCSSGDVQAPRLCASERSRNGAARCVGTLTAPSQISSY